MSRFNTIDLKSRFTVNIFHVHRLDFECLTQGTLESAPKPVGSVQKEAHINLILHAPGNSCQHIPSSLRDKIWYPMLLETYANISYFTQRQNLIPHAPGNSYQYISTSLRDKTRYPTLLETDANISLLTKTKPDTPRSWKLMLTYPRYFTQRQNLIPHTPGNWC